MYIALSWCGTDLICLSVTLAWTSTVCSVLHAFAKTSTLYTCILVLAMILLHVVQGGKADVHFNVYRLELNNTHYHGDLQSPLSKDFTQCCSSKFCWDKYILCMGLCVHVVMCVWGDVCTGWLCMGWRVYGVMCVWGDVCMGWCLYGWCVYEMVCVYVSITKYHWNS